MPHAFGNLLKEFRGRKSGLTQARLAELAGYDPALLTRMAQGRKDLVGPSGRDRVLRIVAVLRDEGVLATAQEADALLAAAGMPSLYPGQPQEAALLCTLVAQEQFVPAVRGLPSRHSLPAPLSRFLGREDDVATVKRLLRDNRLVTLTGVGGVGKTRLALQVAHELLPHFAHGARFVSLAPVDDPALVPAAIARALGVQEQPGQSSLDGVTGYLHAKQVLLLLDNYERLLEAVIVVAELLTAAPQVKVLATSRTPLHLSDEHEYEVPPLDRVTATRLFVQRAQAIRPHFVLNGGNRAVVEEIVERVDRLPLAIELAAAHIRHLTPASLLEQLHPASPLHRAHPSLDGKADGGKGLGLLTDGPRDLPARQQTFWATIGWSYGLLSADEQDWFRRLGVFVGGAALEQIAQLAPTQLAPTQLAPTQLAPMPQVDARAVAGVLQSLVEKSLVHAEIQQDGSVRYSLLELIREYAVAKLGDNGELAETQHRHGEVYCALAQSAVPHLHSHRQNEWLALLEQEHDNLRAALARCLAPGGDALLGLRLANHLWPFWWLSHMGEGRQWLELLLKAAGSAASPAQRGRALLGLAIFLLSLFEWDASVPIGEQAVELLRATGDAEGVALGLANLGIVYGQNVRDLTPERTAQARAVLAEALTISRQTDSVIARSYALYAYGHTLWWWRDCDHAATALEERVAWCRAAGDAEGVTGALFVLCSIALYRLDFGRAKVVAEQSLKVARSGSGYVTLTAALLQAGEVAQLTADLDKAQAYLEQSHALAVENGLAYEAGFTLGVLGRVARDRGDYAHAHALFAQALDCFPRPVDGPYGIEGMACLASAQGQYERAARLFGFVEAYREVKKDPWWQKDHYDLGPYMQRARSGLGDAVFTAAWAEGRAMPLDHTVAYAKQDDGEGGSAT